MAEIITFSEATASFATADGGFHVVAYARDVQADMQRRTHRYRVPQGGVGYTHVNLQDTPATVAMGSLEGPDLRTIKNMITLATPGTLHCRIIGAIPGNNGTGGWVFFSGTFDNASLAGTEGNAEQRTMFNGWFATWSAY